MESETAAREAEILRREAREILRRNVSATQLIEAALVQYGPGRQPMVDVLLDVRNALRRR